MAQGCAVFHEVTFVYESAAEAVFEGLSVRFPAGWTGLIGANGSGKTTLLRLACGELTPQRGTIESPDRVVHCPQRTDEPPCELWAFLDATDRDACVLRGQLAIDCDWATRWETLSHGERKRAQIAVALWSGPGVLAIDEPTNHIDVAGRRMLAGAMRAFRGIGLLVSHDRELLDGICGQCLFIDPPGAVMRPGGYTKAAAQADADSRRARQERAQAKRDLADIEREAGDRRREAARSHRQRSKRGLALKDHDARARKNLARISGKDGQAGRGLRQLDGRTEQARRELDGISVKKQQHLAMSLRGERAGRDTLFRLPAGSIGLGGGRKLEVPELSMRPDERIALVGPNGGGKSTLVRHIVSRLDLPADKVVCVAQEIDRAGAARVLHDVRALPRAELGDVMSAISCLGSSAKRLLETEEPSPGELRKIVLALGMARVPYLIIMDEPTNHLDLPSIECLESALADCPCGLLLVSHDLHFLQRLAPARWELRPLHPAAENRHMRLHAGGRWGPAGFEPASNG